MRAAAHAGMRALRPMIARVSSTPMKNRNVTTAPMSSPAPTPIDLSLSTISAFTSAISRCTSSCTCSGRLAMSSKSDRLRGLVPRAGSVIARSRARAGCRLLRAARRRAGARPRTARTARPLGGRGRLRARAATRDLRDDLLGAVGDELGHLGGLVLHELLHRVDLPLHGGGVPEVAGGRLDLLVALPARARAEHIAHAESGEEEDLAFHGAPFSATRRRGEVTCWLRSRLTLDPVTVRGDCARDRSRVRHDRRETGAGSSLPHATHSVNGMCGA